VGKEAWGIKKLLLWEKKFDFLATPFRTGRHRSFPPYPIVLFIMQTYIVCLDE